MKEHYYLENYNDDSVIVFDERNLIKIKRFKEAIKQVIDNKLLEDVIFSHLNSGCSISIPRKINSSNQETIYQQWLLNGVVCEILNLGSNEWKKGKIHISINVDFYPDEPETPKPPESPLDDIRELMNKDK